MQGAENMKEDREENTPDPSVTETEGSGAFYADDDTLTLSTPKLYRTVCPAEWAEASSPRAADGVSFISRMLERIEI